MQSTNTMIRRLAYTVGLAQIALAVFATGGLGATGEKALECEARAQACMTDAEYRALLIRSVALNRKYGLGTSE
jgi:hypothetical protein